MYQQQPSGQRFLILRTVDHSFRLSRRRLHIPWLQLQFFCALDQLYLVVGGASTSSFTYRLVQNLWNKNSPSLFSTCTFQDSDLLTFNISAHHSWWGEHGPGCVRREMPLAPGVRTTESQSYITVMGCLLDYQYIEVAHSGAQILVAVSTCEKCKYTCATHAWTCNRNSSC